MNDLYSRHYVHCKALTKKILDGESIDLDILKIRQYHQIKYAIKRARIKELKRKKSKKVLPDTVTDEKPTIIFAIPLLLLSIEKKD